MMVTPSYFKATARGYDFDLVFDLVLDNMRPASTASEAVS